MRPTLPTFDATNGVFTNAVIGCYFTLQSVICTYRNHLFSGKLCSSATLAAIAGSMLYTICLIGCRCIPAEIGNVIMLGVSIIVAAFMLCWRWADKGQKHQAMHLHHFKFVVFPKHYRKSSIFLIDAWCFYSASFYRLYTAKIRDFINAFKADNRFPVFHDSPKDSNLKFGIIPLRSMG